MLADKLRTASSVPRTPRTPEFVMNSNTINSDTSTQLVINKPPATSEGDLMIAVMAADSDVTWSGDTGWTEVADQGSSPSVRIAYKIATISEGTSYTFISNSVKKLAGSILTYRYASYDKIGVFTTDSDPLILQSIDPSENHSILIAVGAAKSADPQPLSIPTGMTGRVTVYASNYRPRYIICDQEVSSGPTGIRSIITNTTLNVAGIMLSIKPTMGI